MNNFRDLARAANGRCALSGELSLTAPDPDGAAGKPRSAKRIAVKLNVGLRQRRAAIVTVHLLDLSTHGFRAETHLDLSVGAPVWIRLPGLEPALAHVMWIEGCIVGCAFDRPLHPAVLDLVIGRA